jgi:hypothetical protein
MRVGDFLALRWQGGEEPLIEPPAFSPLIADPSILLPEESGSGEWILYAHSAWGLHEYRSLDGLSWKDGGLRVWNAMRPFLRRHSDGSFVLLYEKYRPLALPLQALPGKRRWRSRIELMRGADIAGLAFDRTVLRPEAPWMRNAYLGNSVSNPCLVESRDGKLRLYFSASLCWIDDCGFCEPRYIGAAEADSIEGAFAPRPGPIIDPVRDQTPGVLGAGSLKAIELEDGWVGLQNKIYRDPAGRSRSAIFLLRSEDGMAWSQARSEPLVAPGSGWKASHVYACDCRFRENEGRCYLYFNARDEWSISKGRERIGRIVSE